MASPRKNRRTSSLTWDDDDADDAITTVDEAKIVIRELRQKCRTQTQQLLAWKRRVRQQEEQSARADAIRSAQLSHLSGQLLLLEARLLRKRRDIDSLLGQRDSVIGRQARVLAALQARLVDAGLDAEVDADSPLDSLNDSDSAVVLDDDSILFRSGSRVGRSISDAGDPSGKLARRSNGFLRRPEILETVYSVEEDADGDSNQNATASTASMPVAESAEIAPAPVADAPALEAEPSATSTPVRTAADAYIRSPHRTMSDTPARPADAYPFPPTPVRSLSDVPLLKKRASWTCSRSPALELPLPPLPTHPPPPVNTYNRVMSNHRSVTKVKDVKYKRINKAKSKSLEELRGRLKNWVDKGQSLSAHNVVALTNSDA